MTAGEKLCAVLFDLDGTLVDTAPDMIGAVNALCRQEGRRLPAPDRARAVVSHGSAGLVRLAFGDDLGERELADLCRRFLGLYEQRLCDETHLFPGADSLLMELDENAIAWGIVTNKPGWLTRPLVRALGLSNRAGCVVCGDCLPERKPHPLPLLHAARQLDRTPAQCLFVGDAERDIQAGKAAAMTTLVAAYGYIGEDEQWQSWGADGSITAPGDISRLVGGDVHAA